MNIIKAGINYISPAKMSENQDQEESNSQMYDLYRGRLRPPPNGMKPTGMKPNNTEQHIDVSNCAKKACSENSVESDLTWHKFNGFFVIACDGNKSEGQACKQSRALMRALGEVVNAWNDCRPPPPAREVEAKKRDKDEVYEDTQGHSNSTPQAKMKARVPEQEELLPKNLMQEEYMDASSESTVNIPEGSAEVREAPTGNEKDQMTEIIVQTAMAELSQEQISVSGKRQTVVFNTEQAGVLAEITAQVFIKDALPAMEADSNNRKRMIRIMEYELTQFDESLKAVVPGKEADVAKLEVMIAKSCDSKNVVDKWAVKIREQDGLIAIATHHIAR